MTASPKLQSSASKARSRWPWRKGRFGREVDDELMFVWRRFNFHVIETDWHSLEHRAVQVIAVAVLMALSRSLPAASGSRARSSARACRAAPYRRQCHPGQRAPNQPAYPPRAASFSRHRQKLQAVPHVSDREHSRTHAQNAPIHRVEGAGTPLIEWTRGTLRSLSRDRYPHLEAQEARFPIASCSSHSWKNVCLIAAIASIVMHLSFMFRQRRAIASTSLMGSNGLTIQPVAPARRAGLFSLRRFRRQNENGNRTVQIVAARLR